MKRIYQVKDGDKVTFEVAHDQPFNWNGKRYPAGFFTNATAAEIIKAGFQPEPVFVAEQVDRLKRMDFFTALDAMLVANDVLETSDFLTATDDWLVDRINEHHDELSRDEIRRVITVVRSSDYIYRSDPRYPGLMNKLRELLGLTKDDWADIFTT